MVEKVGVEREDHVGLVELVSGLDRPAERQLRASDDVVAIDRLVLVPLGLGKMLQQRLQLVGQRRR